MIVKKKSKAELLFRVTSTSLLAKWAPPPDLEKAVNRPQVENSELNNALWFKKGGHVVIKLSETKLDIHLS